MNTISMCRPVPAVPEQITLTLLLNKMRTLEQLLAATNPIFEEDLYMGLLEMLAVCYYQVNHFPELRKMMRMETR